MADPNSLTGQYLTGCARSRADDAARAGNRGGR